MQKGLSTVTPDAAATRKPRPSGLLGSIRASGVPSEVDAPKQGRGHDSGTSYSPLEDEG